MIHPPACRRAIESAPGPEPQARLVRKTSDGARGGPEAMPSDRHRRGHPSSRDLRSGPRKKPGGSVSIEMAATEPERCSSLRQAPRARLDVASGIARMPSSCSGALSRVGFVPASGSRGAARPAFARSRSGMAAGDRRGTCIPGRRADVVARVRFVSRAAAWSAAGRAAGLGSATRSCDPAAERTVAIFEGMSLGRGRARRRAGGASGRLAPARAPVWRAWSVRWQRMSSASAVPR
jgi:hypothetical protein